MRHVWEDPDGDYLFYHDEEEGTLVVRTQCCGDRVYWRNGYGSVFCSSCRETLRTPQEIVATYIFINGGKGPLQRFISNWAHVEVEDVEVTIEAGDDT